MLPSLLVLSVLAGIPVDGRVHDPAGVGLAGAHVELRPVLSRHEQGLRELEGRPLEPAVRTVTGADGRFELLAPDTGMWEVTVSAEGFVPRRFRLTPLLEARTLPPAELKGDAGLRVRIVSPAGRPLPGARVFGRPWNSEEPGWQTIPRVATAGADGVARLPCSRDDLLWLFAMAPGFPVQEGPEARGPADVTLRLKPGTARRIEARGANGALLRDLRTSLVLGRIRNGRAEVAALSGDEPWVELETADGASLRFAVPGPIRLDLLPPAPPLPGRVIDGPTRQPLADAWVWLQDDPARFVRTGADGGYRLPRPRKPELAGLEVAAVGYLSEVADEHLPWPADRLPSLALFPGRVPPFEDPGGEGSVAGRILNPDGSPVLDGEVELRSGKLKVGPAVLGPEGRFAFARLKPGWYEVLVLRPGALGQRLARFHVGDGGGETDLRRITLRPEKLLTGRLQTPDGKPVAGADVWASALAWGDPVAQRWPAAVSGPDGSFTLRAATGEEVQLTVCRTGVQPLGEDLAQLFPDEILELTLQPSAVFAGRVTAPDGSPVANESILMRSRGAASTWYPSCEGAEWYNSDSAGRFRIDSLEPGYYSVAGRLFTLVSGKTIETTLPGGSGPAQTVLSGRLLDEAGSPVPGVLISFAVRVPHGNTYWSWTATARSDGDGNYRIEFDEPEVHIAGYALSLQDDWTVLMQSLEWSGPGILRGEVAHDLTVKERPGPARPSGQPPPDPVEGDVTVTGRILGLPAEALSRATLTALQGDADEATGAIDARGVYRFDGLRPGDLRIRLAADGGQTFESLYIPAGETRIERDLLVGPLVEVEGVVELPNSLEEESVAGATVRFNHLARPFETSTPEIRARTRQDGTFSIRLPRGEYTVQASRPGFLAPAWAIPPWAETVEECRFPFCNLMSVPLEATARLSGRLSGLPPEEDLKIEARRLNQKGFQYPLLGRMVTADTYFIAGLGPGTWEITATYEPFGDEERTATGRVEIPENPADASLDLDFSQ